MNTLQHAITFIRENKAPFWRLMVRYDGSSSYTKLYSYEPTQDPEADKAEEAVAQLERKLSIQNHPTAQFQLFAKTTATGNKESEFGPFPFVLSGQSGTPGVSGLGSNPAISFAGLGSLGEIFQTFQTIQGMKDQAMFEKFSAMLDRKDQENDLKHRELKLAEREKEVSGLELKFNSNSEKVMAGVMKAGGLLFEAFAPTGAAKEAAGTIISGLTGKPENSAGVKTETSMLQGPVKPVEEEDTKEEKIINAISLNIFEHVQDAEGLMAVGTLVNEIVRNPELIDKYKTILKNSKTQSQSGSEENTVSDAK